MSESRAKPIIFSGPMVRTILAGRKTQTRRICKKQDWDEAIVKRWPNQHHTGYEVGGLLWVREAWSTDYHLSGRAPRMLCPAESNIWYWADGNPPDGDWTKPKPSIHMPRWASRLTLTVTAVKVERLKEIGPDDVMAEGCPVPFEEYDVGPASWFGAGEWWEDLWRQINGRGSWDENPWVAAISFTVEKKNIDAPAFR